MPVLAVSVAKDVLFLGDMGVHSLGEGSRIRIGSCDFLFHVFLFGMVVYRTGMFGGKHDRL